MVRSPDAVAPGGDAATPAARRGQDESEVKGRGGGGLRDTLRRLARRPVRLLRPPKRSSAVGMVRETRHLWVGNLPKDVREDKITEHFERSVRLATPSERRVHSLGRKGLAAVRTAIVGFRRLFRVLSPQLFRRE